MEVPTSEVDLQVSQIISRFEEPILRSKKPSDSNEKLVLSSERKSKEEIIVSLRELISHQYEEGSDSETVASPVILPSLDSSSCTAVIWQSVATYLSALDLSHLILLNKELSSSVSKWLSAVFRFPESEAITTEDSMVQLTRSILSQKYPTFKECGFEALVESPPVFYASSEDAIKYLQSICQSLGLPLKSVRTVPSDATIEFEQKMNTDALASLMEEDKVANKSPFLVLADTGWRVSGQCDSLQSLRQLCNQHGAWLHLKGHAVSIFSQSSLSMSVMPDSFSIDLSTWYGILGLPPVILHKKLNDCDDALEYFSEISEPKFSILPLWASLMSIGFEDLHKRLLYCFESCERMWRIVSKYPCLRILSQAPSGDDLHLSFEEFLSKHSESESIIESVVTCVLFQFTPDNFSESAVPSDYNKLNSWLGQILQRDMPMISIQYLSLKPFGIVLRYCPFESKPNLPEDCEKFSICLEQQLEILTATVGYKQTFINLVNSSECLQLVEMESWAGLGGVRYIPVGSNYSNDELNKLNTQLVEQLRNTDAAFSIGEGSDNTVCVRFGMITSETDVVELLRLVEMTGKEQEESWKYIDTMAEVVKKGIEAATLDLQKESEDKLWQEGILRHVPVFGSLVNWWSPVNKEPINGSTGIKGRSLNLAAGVVESTENIYKYHMQNLPPSPQPSITPSPSLYINGANVSNESQSELSPSL
ncbi:unnamed protein product [Bemisia tabaci]|uniref:Pyridoxal-dependent decarboxylase domain-containing protein 1 n=2 Tax=Bemisia tabaci TaxID=7038 RepID=A0A9P0EYI5_BEMTA|nr:unnamed protein product [Bemisia tabaci]